MSNKKSSAILIFENEYLKTSIHTENLYVGYIWTGGILVSELASMKNIGKEIEKKLISIGIDTAEELKQIGSKDAFVRLKLQYQNVCLVHLYALEGAIKNIEYTQLSEETKQTLKEFCDGIN